MDEITDNVTFLSGLRERDYMDFIAKKVVANSVVWDVGANAGYLALWLATRLKGVNNVRLVAFEPDGPHYEQHLQPNLGLNPGLAVTPYRVALGGERAQREFLSHGSGDGSARLASSMEGSKPGKCVASLVEVRTADGFGVEHPRPSWIIIDVEGFAGGVLEGASKLFQQFKPTVAVEIHDAKEDAAVTSFLGRLNYRKTEILSPYGRHQVWSFDQ